MHPRYKEWISHLFVETASNEDNSPFVDETEIAELIELTFRNSGSDLQGFTDTRLNQGLWDLVSSSGSDYLFVVLCSESVPLSRRLSAIASITVLYRDLFQKRCTQTLSHLDEQPSSPLNAVCYMFWDICALSYLGDYPDKKQIADACFTVLASTFEIDHLACREAAIHGYGELSSFYRTRVDQTLDKVLQTEIADARLRNYANSARFHYIQ